MFLESVFGGRDSHCQSLNPKPETLNPGTYETLNLKAAKPRSLQHFCCAWGYCEAFGLW